MESGIMLLSGVDPDNARYARVGVLYIQLAGVWLLGMAGLLGYQFGRKK